MDHLTSGVDYAYISLLKILIFDYNIENLNLCAKLSHKHVMYTFIQTNLMYLVYVLCLLYNKRNRSITKAIKSNKSLLKCECYRKKTI